MTDTPVSDKNKCRFSSLFAGDDAFWVNVNVSKKLERELNEAKAEITRLREELHSNESMCQSLAHDNSEKDAEVTRLRWELDGKPANGYHSHKGRNCICGDCNLHGIYTGDDSNPAGPSPFGVIRYYKCR